MKILGISEGHTCSAAIMIDGKIIASASEERFTGLKNDSGYPKLAIDFCLAQAGIKPQELDRVMFASKQTDLWWAGVRNEATLSVADHVFEQYEFYKKLLIDKIPTDEVVSSYLQQLRERKGAAKTHYQFGDATDADLLKPEVLLAIRNRTVVHHLGVDESIVGSIDHHECHAAHAYFSSPIREDNVLIVTLDSSGDRGINATLRVTTPTGITLLHESSNFQFARIYKYITLLLGMRPHDHEYKVMGLAPYANEKEVAKSYPVFDEIQKVDGFDFVWDKRPSDLYFHFRNRFEGHRFDGIAGALQKKLETMVGQWVDNALKKTGATSVVFGGGVAMNIKLSMTLAQHPQVKRFYVGPSPADESNGMGVCYAAYYAYCQENGLPYQTSITPLADAYLGDEFDATGFLSLIAQEAPGKYEVITHATDAMAAKLLADGTVVARCIGRMEFGARALGNRSLLANPSRRESVKEINRQIKHRDFWMPFACSVLEEAADRYLVNDKKFAADYMTLGFATKPPAHTELLAGIHAEDLTARPQIVRQAQNAGYHHLISEFQTLTGIGGLLNTSLNLHGYPIVRTPKDLLFVLEQSDLECVYIKDHIVKKRSYAAA